jgi:hypothetical protein
MTNYTKKKGKSLIKAVALPLLGVVTGLGAIVHEFSKPEDLPCEGPHSLEHKIDDSYIIECSKCNAVICDGTDGDGSKAIMYGLISNPYSR